MAANERPEDDRSKLAELYQATVIDHSRHPRNYGRLSEATHHAQGYNPLCGDRVDVYVEESAGEIRRVSFEAAACAICTASASLMTELAGGCERRDLEALYRCLLDLVGLAGTGERTAAEAAAAGGEKIAIDGGFSGSTLARQPPAAVSDLDPESVSRLAALAGVRSYPLRAQCAVLPWNTLREALGRAAKR